MKIGIIGLPQTGKKTLFQILTGHVFTEHSDQKKPAMGMADIIDQRFDTLVQMYKPKKQVRAKIDLELLPKLFIFLRKLSYCEIIMRLEKKNPCYGQKVQKSFWLQQRANIEIIHGDLSVEFFQ